MHCDIPRVLSGAVVTARTIETLRSNKVQSYKGSSTEEPKDGRRHEIHLPLIHSPL
jgi:ribosomal protein L21